MIPSSSTARPFSNRSALARPKNKKKPPRVRMTLSTSGDETEPMPSTGARHEPAQGPRRPREPPNRLGGSRPGGCPLLAEQRFEGRQDRDDAQAGFVSGRECEACSCSHAIPHDAHSIDSDNLHRHSGHLFGLCHRRVVEVGVEPTGAVAQVGIVPTYGGDTALGEGPRCHRPQSVPVTARYSQALEQQDDTPRFDLRHREDRREMFIPEWDEHRMLNVLVGGHHAIASPARTTPPSVTGTRSASTHHETVLAMSASLRCAIDSTFVVGPVSRSLGMPKRSASGSTMVSVRHSPPRALRRRTSRSKSCRGVADLDTWRTSDRPRKRRTLSTMSMPSISSNTAWRSGKPCTSRYPSRRIVAMGSRASSGLEMPASDSCTARLDRIMDRMKGFPRTTGSRTAMAGERSRSAAMTATAPPNRAPINPTSATRHRGAHECDRVDGILDMRFQSDVLHRKLAVSVSLRVESQDGTPSECESSRRDALRTTAGCPVPARTSDTPPIRSDA